VLPEYRHLLKTALEEASAISTEKPKKGYQITSADAKSRAAEFIRSLIIMD